MAHTYHRRSYASPALWVDCVSGIVPSNSPVVGGNDVNGEPIYVCRAVHNRDTIPGKMVPSHRVGYVAYDGKEHAHQNYQVLTNPNHACLAWVPASSGQIPTGALLGGEQADGTPLYIGRAYHHSSLIVGKVHPRHHVLYVPFAGSEIAIKSYEVLVIKNANTAA